MLHHRELLVGSSRAEALGPLLDLAEQTLRTWTPSWSPFLDGGLREEAEARLGPLVDLHMSRSGGHPAAERCRLLFQRAEAPLPSEELAGDFAGLEIAGNFLFDPADPADFDAGLLAAGATAGEVGDLWARGDRGAQAIVAEALAGRRNGLAGQVRSVAVRFQARPLDELQLPPARRPRSLSTVEASRRLDAVASAGFGLSRSRMAELIRQGAVRIDWTPVTSPSRELAVGERVQVQGRGELRIEAVELTRRDRYRIRLERH
jgi:photosystem II S4 domain protein